MTPERRLYWQLKLVYNLLMLAVAWLTSIALVQHAAFIYTMPPDLSRWIQVPWTAYLLLAGVLWIGYKLLHYAEVKAEVALKRITPGSMGCSPPKEDSPLTPHGILAPMRTCELIEELKLREGVEWKAIAPNEPPATIERIGTGPAIVLVVYD
jgi:hypothetical protein